MKLLFIEDEYYTSQGIQQSLDWTGLGISQLFTAANGRQGLNKLVDQPDIILTDIRLPFFSGLEIAMQAKQVDPLCELIILSSYSDKDYLFTAISLSTVAYLEKPVDLSELNLAVKQAVDRRRKSLLLQKLQAVSVTTGSLSSPCPEGLPNPNNQAYSHHTRCTLWYLTEHGCDQDLSLESIATQVHLNPAYLSEIFKKETGRNLKRVISDIRLAKACELLRHSSLSIAEVAAQCGFRSANYFTKWFRQESGANPHEFRHQSGIRS